MPRHGQGALGCASSPSAPNTSCGSALICDPVGQCVTNLVTSGTDCATGTLSGDQLCQGLGFTGATKANGYWWGQCAGTLDYCPGGWSGDGTVCANWCDTSVAPFALDCAGTGFCSGAFHWSVKSVLGNGATPFNPSQYQNCNGWNPGWTVRLLCYY